MSESSPRPSRTWGYWTRFKLELLEKYLKAFARTTKNLSTERVYLDAFAGEGSGTDRLTGKPFPGSARIALTVDDPPFTRLRYFELSSQAEALRAQLKAEYPERDLLVYGGDCNEMIPKALDGLRPLRWAPTFAFLDPDGMELAWSTLQRLASHKRGYRGPASQKPEFKVEMWMLFPSSGLMRTLKLETEELGPQDEEGVTQLFGSEQWRGIYGDRKAERIDGAQARDAYVNLMRWRLERELGYAWTHPLEIKNLQGVPIYHMILATDNEAGTKIISGLYTDAAKKIPAMREEALQQQKEFRQDRLFDDPVEVEPYTYEPPWDPSEGSSD